MKNLPDKIYLDIRGFENVDMSFSEVRQRFGVPYYEHSMSNNDVEYVRTGAFIEKALDFIRSCTTYDGLGYKAKCVNIEEFKNYMKRE